MKKAPTEWIIDILYVILQHLVFWVRSFFLEKVHLDVFDKRGTIHEELDRVGKDVSDLDFECLQEVL
jgi:hypothetical protein